LGLAPTAATDIAAGNAAVATSITAGGTIDLNMPNGVFDNAGGGTLITPASWRIWASNFTGETRGGLLGSGTLPNLYGCAYSTGCGWSTSGSYTPVTGDQFIYAVRPTVTVTADDQTRAVGTANPAFTTTIAGLLNGDTAAVLLGGASTDATANADVGQYAITSHFTAANGYLVRNVSGTLSVVAPAASLAPLTTANVPVSGSYYVANSPLLRSGLQALFTSASDTSVYENNMNGTNVCVSATAPILAPGADGDIPWAERDWKLMRSMPNLNSCIAFNTEHGCNQY
jgi:hypothetical protein